MVEKIKLPGGASHTFVPRPLPATCVVAEIVKPVGSLATSFGFLIFLIRECFVEVKGWLTSRSRC